MWPNAATAINLSVQDGKPIIELASVPCSADTRDEWIQKKKKFFNAKNLILGIDTLK